jgi:hypothetical protein
MYFMHSIRRTSNVAFYPDLTVILPYLGFTDMNVTRTFLLIHNPVKALHVQARGKDDISADQLPCLVHLLIQARISDQPRRTHDFPTRLVQPRDNPHDRAFHHVRQIRDAVE